MLLLAFPSSQENTTTMVHQITREAGRKISSTSENKRRKVGKNRRRDFPASQKHDVNEEKRPKMEEKRNEPVLA